MKLYGYFRSSAAYRVRIALNLKGLAYRQVALHLRRGEQMTAESLARNPQGLVPVLELADGTCLIQSAAILEYLEDAFSGVPLRPAAPRDRARMRVWAKTPDDGLHAACGTVTYAAAFADQVLAFHGRQALDDRLARLPDRARAARQSELFDKRLGASIVPGHVRLYDRVLREMETTLSDEKWLAGETFSIAECAMLPYVWRLERLNLSAMWADRPNVADWFARAKARPSWDRAMEAYPSLGGHDYDDDLRSKGVDLWPKIEAMLSD